MFHLFVESARGWIDHAAPRVSRVSHIANRGSHYEPQRTGLPRVNACWVWDPMRWFS
jgi:hypothetical protein